MADIFGYDDVETMLRDHISVLDKGGVPQFGGAESFSENELCEPVIYNEMFKDGV